MVMSHAAHRSHVLGVKVPPPARSSVHGLGLNSILDVAGQSVAPRRGVHADQEHAGTARLRGCELAGEALVAGG